MIKAVDKELILFTDNGKVLGAWGSMSKLLESFPGTWLRASRNCAVKVTQIAEVRRRKVILENGEQYPVSRRQFDAISQAALSIDRSRRYPDWND